MKKLMYDYLLFFYLNFIKEDFSTLKTWSFVFVKPAWFLRSILMWILSPLGFPFFILYKKNEKSIKVIVNEFLLVSEEIMLEFYDSSFFNKGKNNK